MSSIGFSLKEKFKQNMTLTYIILGLFIILLPFLLNSYHVHVINIIGIFIIMSLSLDIALGRAGLIHIAPTAFYGIGAYFTGIFMLRVMPQTAFAYWLALPLVIILTGLIGFLVVLPGLRLRGMFFAVATIGFGEVAFSIFNNWVDMTGGPYGLKSIPRPQIMSFVIDSNVKFYFFIYFFVIIVCILVFRLVNGPTGRAWMAVREDEIGATSLGINIKRAKIEAFITSAVLSGIAGWIFAPYVTYLSPNNFTELEAIFVLTMVIIGGRGSFIGPIFGAVLLIFLQEILRPIESFRMLVFSLILLIVIIYRPQGLFGRLKK
jgi:branched-chain amino acid transport system permease protein